MGVSGSGKSTIGKLLSTRLNIPFFDGDDYHPQSNIDKMKKGIPLSDNDRQGWLITLNHLAIKQVSKSSCIIVCSALKASYRGILSAHLQNQVQWIYLSGGFNLIFSRIKKREQHFMSSDLLQSQFDTLELPKHALTIDIGLTPEAIVEKIIKELK